MNPEKNRSNKHGLFLSENNGHISTKSKANESKWKANSTHHPEQINTSIRYNSSDGKWSLVHTWANQSNRFPFRVCVSSGCVTVYCLGSESCPNVSALGRILFVLDLLGNGKHRGACVCAYARARALIHNIRGAFRKCVDFSSGSVGCCVVVERPGVNYFYGKLRSVLSSTFAVRSLSAVL